DAAQQQYKDFRQQLESTHTQDLRSATTERQERTWEAQALLEATKSRPRDEMLETEQRLNDIRAELGALESDSTSIMKMRRQWQESAPIDVVAEEPPAGSPGEQSAPNADPVGTAINVANERAAAVREAALALYKQLLPRLFEDEFLLLPFLLTWVAAIILC